MKEWDATAVVVVLIHKDTILIQNVCFLFQVQCDCEKKSKKLTFLAEDTHLNLNGRLLVFKETRQSLE